VTDLYLSYLEVLDDEYWELAGQGNRPRDPLREAYTDARRRNAPEEERRDAEAAFRRDLIRRLHEANRSALCFSGGGIRSATFGLGILQGLASRSADFPERSRPALLGEFDYLSTVSGGGYVGGWFSAWATRLSHRSCKTHRECDERGGTDGPAEVIRLLAKNPDTGFDPEPVPVRHLRAYSNYLMPRTGLLSGDTWAAAGTVVRNMFLNWLVLLPIFAVILLIPWAARMLLTADFQTYQPHWFLVISGFLLGALATAYVGYDLPSAGNARKSYKPYLWCCLLPLTFAAIHLNTFWAWLPAGSREAPWWDVIHLGRTGLTWLHFGVFGGAMHGGGMLAGIVYAMAVFHRPAPKIGLYATSAALGTGFVGGLVAFAFARAATSAGAWNSEVEIRYTCLAFPLVMGVFLLAGTLLVGLTSYVTEDQDREWWARSGGLVLAIALAWPLFSAIVLYSPKLIPWLNMQLGTALTAGTGLAGWAVSKIGGSVLTPWARRDENPSASNVPAKPPLADKISALLLPVFLVLLAMLLSLMNFNLAPWFAGFFQWVPSLWPDGLKSLGDATAPILWLALGYIALCSLASLFINVNKFSLHAMYRQRLIRAYLGASNTKRSPHWFTGFDENDNISMCALTSYKPLHVINMTLNLVSGKQLAWQQRKAESFTSTRLHTGSCRVGYRPSKEYGGRYRQTKGKTPISLGTSITISGAAASPNMGYNSSPLLRLVMTLFNARLGWWLGNPGDRSNDWKLPGPRFGVRPFLDEVLGLTNDENPWIYLSDGGHFENLGIYEMVLRRCRWIVVSDASADPAYSYEDLGNAVRKIRIDLGISIEFEGGMPMSPVHKPAPDFSAHHCAIGRIRYATVDGDVPDGVLIYIKPSLSGDEPADVRHYASRDRRFPHQPTSDQFFDEAQFESYRRLGLHIVEKISEHSGDAQQLDLAGFIRSAVSYAGSPSP